MGGAAGGESSLLSLPSQTAEERRARAHAPGLDVPALTASQDGALAAAKTVSVRATALEITLAVIRETLSTYHTIAGGM